MFNTDVNTLSARLNGIPGPDVIEAGRVIRVPKDGMPDSIRIYIVKDGDSLYEIGKKYGYSTEELAATMILLTPINIYRSGHKIPRNGRRENVRRHIYR